MRRALPKPGVGYLSLQLSFGQPTAGRRLDSSRFSACLLVASDSKDHNYSGATETDELEIDKNAKNFVLVERIALLAKACAKPQ
ncbi:hypothetical protein PtA15_7A559 [Puccinia triticina]|uniref:Uncharacterized protein n=1 Tax=Puccinia triticina TaxID=208348 RepID=A0ABY7CP66_9BASI|nr:uncharacterized protein PtA15_7A559 [Puccinia triticina]WAQ86830.1 hypothetical protein PtA15_7A559 [Puccinia triticina]